MTTLEQIVLTAFVTGAFSLGGAVLITVSDNQVALARTSVATQEISKDMQELKYNLTKFDQRIDDNEKQLAGLEFLIRSHHEAGNYLQPSREK